MNRARASTTALLELAIGIALIGCNSSSGMIGTGATGGGGGMGGSETAMLRVAHFASDVPLASATEMDFVIPGEGSFNSIGFGQVAQYATVRTGRHIVSANEPGAGGELLSSITAPLEIDGRYTIVAYRDSREAAALGLMILEEETAGLAMGSGRVLIGHAADDNSWQTVNVVDFESDQVFAADLVFRGQTVPRDLVAGEYLFDFDVLAPVPIAAQGLFRLNVETGQSSLLIVVDHEVMDESVDVAVYAIGPTTVGPVSPLPSE